MNRPKSMLVANIAWASEMSERSPDFFDALSRGQNPRVLWIGCADSRVPAETITQSAPGELFVHRNIANIFQPDDDNCVSVLEYAVRVLKVDHVIVCGHYGCGGVRASLLPPSPELPHVSRRIAPLCALAGRHRAALDGVPPDQAADRLAELNVLEQVRLLRSSPIVRDADPAPLVHGWIFSLADGRLKELASGYAAAEPQPQTERAEATAA
ncbi:carbonic anhydrase [Burkholderia mayonis]|uniref:Carbonic anhydrase n=1 Tax=Burkholderia mayonis TaxID=1385591 RepID=A0A1B4G4G2_9BURK|nr:carbonic anhydrase [Burkholderia mayonis]AOJ10791.1 carbonic anhydrase [Burkholderia mayonis]KVE57922.1 carbonic anhydrase [Burkholderia mayonis]